MRWRGCVALAYAISIAVRRELAAAARRLSNRKPLRDEIFRRRLRVRLLRCGDGGGRRALARGVAWRFVGVRSIALCANHSARHRGFNGRLQRSGAVCGARGAAAARTRRTAQRGS
jgi:hypothetical protein